MTSQPPQPSDEPVYADRVYRSPMGILSGVMLLALIAWVCGDAVLRGDGNAPWYGVAATLFLVPLVVAFTLRPAVFSNDHRLRIRNPFRTIELPWGTVDAVRAGYTSEVLAGGAKYQMWSIPVSLRDRKRANKKTLREKGGAGEVVRSGTDQIVHDLQELAERSASLPAAQGSIGVRWSYEIIAPAVAGAILLLVLLVTR
ncbi:PH domain-containing protein [Streptomyces sp. NPDC090022]|uniref:PH domain-containing protein n=1 Tax=Streptomyces sp. NPDC090022 TaxID=3365920 RepID=UPI0037F23306